MIKLISDIHPYSLLEIGSSETTATLQQKLIAATAQSFEIELIETSNNRVLPRDEILIDQREYFINYLRLPVKGGV